MENYIVSARKYRPATFESVVGQRALTTTLKNAISTGKLAHAYLFCGPRGVGKTTCARIFAKTINCMNPTPQGEACNECESCKAFNEQRSYNIHELDAASNNSVDDIRQLVEQVRIPPQIGRYKVFIIDEVHMLSTSAFNAFLKTLEEPPHHAIFILATTEKHKILPTILSRCQIYDFSRISIEDTVAHLVHVAQQEGIKAEPEALNVIALKADGGMRDALSIFDQVVSYTGGNITYQSVIENLNVLDYEYYFRLTDYFLENKVSDALLLLNEVLNKGFDGSHFMTGLSSHLRDLLVSKDAATLELLEVGAEIRNRYQVQAQKCPLKFIYRAMKLCNDCDLNYRASKNKRLLIELTLIQVAQITVEEDDAAGGRSPKHVIKPLFKQVAPKPQAGATGTTPPTSSPSTHVATAPRQSAPAHTATTTLLSAAQKKEAKSTPVMSLNGLGISIKQQTVSNHSQTTAPPTQGSKGGSISNTPSVEEDYIFNERDANYYWMEYAMRLPKEQTAMAQRMKNMHLALIKDTTIEAAVENEIVGKEFAAMVPEIQQYLQTKLKNRKLRLTITVNEAESKERAYSRVERFQLMAKKNNALALLKEKLGLELY